MTLKHLRNLVKLNVLYFLHSYSLIALGLATGRICSLKEFYSNSNKPHKLSCVQKLSDPDNYNL